MSDFENTPTPEGNPAGPRRRRRRRGRGKGPRPDGSAPNAPSASSGDEAGPPSQDAAPHTAQGQGFEQSDPRANHSGENPRQQPAGSEGEKRRKRRRKRKRGNREEVGQQPQQHADDTGDATDAPEQGEVAQPKPRTIADGPARPRQQPARPQQPATFSAPPRNRRGPAPQQDADDEDGPQEGGGGGAKKRKTRTKNCATCFTPCKVVHKVKIDHRRGWVFICDICWPAKCVGNPHYQYEATWVAGRLMRPGQEERMMRYRPHG